MAKSGANARDEDFLDRKFSELDPKLQDSLSARAAKQAASLRDKLAALVVTTFLLLVVAGAGLLGYMIYTGGAFTDTRIQNAVGAVVGMLGLVMGVVGVIVGYYMGASTRRG